MSPLRSYVKVSRAKGEAQTREALLDAAEATVFGAEWDSVSLEAIARAAGVTKPTLLRHFGSKEGLLQATFARAGERVRRERFAAPTDDVAGAVDNLLEHYEKHGDRALTLGTFSGRLGEALDSAKRLHYDWVDHAFGTQLDRARDGERLRAALIAICDVHTWAILRRDLGLDTVAVRATLITTISRLLEEDR